MKLLVIGLTPSTRYSKSPTLKRLKEWLKILEVKFSSFENLYPGDEEYDESVNKYFIKAIALDYDKVIALGNVVSKELSSMGIHHFKLPHPSGRNRKLNDLELVNKELKACKKYLDGNSNEIL